MTGKIVKEGGGQIIVWFLDGMPGRGRLRREPKESLIHVSSCFPQTVTLNLILRSDEPEANWAQRWNTDTETLCSGDPLLWANCLFWDVLMKILHWRTQQLMSCRARLTSLATRTTSALEEKKNICQSSKCFSYQSPTQGRFPEKMLKTISKDFKIKLFQSNDFLIGWNRLFYTCYGNGLTCQVSCLCVIWNSSTV